MKSTVKVYGLAIACGVFLALSFPTWHLYPVAWLALAPLFYLVHRLKPWNGFKLFFLAGWVFHSILLQWLIANIYWAGGWAVWGYQLLCVYMAIYWGLFGLLWTWIHRRVPQYVGALAAAVLWASMEYFQSNLFTGFGWGSLAYSQGKDIMLIQWAALGGTALVSAILVFFNALVGLLLAEKRLRVFRVLAAVTVVVVSHGVGALLLDRPDHKAMPLRVGLVQANFPLEMKWDKEYTEEMVRNAAQKSRWLAQYEQVDLLVWPESLIVEPLDRAPELLEIVSSLTRDSQCALFTGSLRLNEATGGYCNSGFLVDSTGTIVNYYDKVHLAPFGEYAPLREYFPLIETIVPIIGDVEPGDELKVLPLADRRFGPLICFEVLYPGLAEELRARGADFLVVITNLAWFGSSNAIPQELDIARIRAIETRLPVVHCANSGISGVFDPWGRFSVVNAVFDAAGRQIKFQDLDPMDTRMYRYVGALPVAAPGPRPIPQGPRAFPWIAIAASICIFVAALLPLEQATKDGKIFVNG